MHIVALDAGGLEAIEVVRSQIVVGLVVAHHMVDADQQTMRERDDGFLFAAPAC